MKRGYAKVSECGHYFAHCCTQTRKPFGEVKVEVEGLALIVYSALEDGLSGRFDGLAASDLCIAQ